jgi:hypothetical protein
VEVSNGRPSGLNASASSSAIQPSNSNSTLPASLSTSTRSSDAIREGPSTEFSSLFASDSSYSIWPEDLAVVFPDPGTTNAEDGDNASIANTISQLSLGEYHSSRLAVHDRSDTSSPSGVSTSEEDEDDNSDQNPYRIRNTRRPATAEPYPRSTQARVLWRANGHEESDVDRDIVVAHKHGWKGSNANAVQREEQDMAESGEGEEAVANRLPNEIIMNVSIPPSSI